MDPNTARELAPILGIPLVGPVASVPLAGPTVRFAARPLVQGPVRYCEVQLQGHQAEQVLQMHDRRLGLIEAELHLVQTSPHRLVEGEEFRRQRGAGPPQR